MARPKGSLNKKTLEKLGKLKPAKAAVKGKRGRPALKTKRGRPAKVKFDKYDTPAGDINSTKQSFSFSEILKHYEEIKEFIQLVKPQISKLLEVAKFLLELQKSGFLDGWKHFFSQVDHATPAQYMALHSTVVPLLGITEEDLEKAVLGEDEGVSEETIEPSPVAEETKVAEPKIVNASNNDLNDL